MHSPRSADRLALVAVVSGRPVEFLREHAAIPGAVLVGQYGLETLVDGRVVVDASVTPYLDAVAAAAEEAAADLARPARRAQG